METETNAPNKRPHQKTRCDDPHNGPAANQSRSNTNSPPVETPRREAQQTCLPPKFAPDDPDGDTGARRLPPSMKPTDAWRQAAKKLLAAEDPKSVTLAPKTEKFQPPPLPLGLGTEIK